MFTLSKWYADCVAENGDVFIGYSARLNWGSVSLDYASTLESRNGGDAKACYTLRHEKQPDIEAGSCVWEAAGLRLRGVWNSLAAPISPVAMLTCDEGSVDWWCGMPLAEAKLEFGGRREIHGRGYVENLTLTLPPWRLPIDNLRWGHFVSEHEYAVWIDWTGTHNHRIAIVNGHQADDSEIADDRLSLNGGTVRIVMDPGQCLRDGRIGSTALSIVPGVSTLFPDQLLKVRETKWCSRAVLHREGQSAIQGWAVHERVAWK